ncbi:hypothetical protein D1007_41551 [Hordeum vulgare]|uniref:Protein kinase domain-containing protein n=2 Tax=Hordeum vulgare subsp. vulgare TaxID=112509 RepID=A0A8I7B6D3_HORVV|nr:hypothetical protein D1007_41551 [Hordeum vulgare]
MVDVVSGVKQILHLALKVKEAAETVKQNKEECHDIRRRVHVLHGILLSLTADGTEVIANSVVSDALGDLERSLQRALELVTTCQGKSGISNCWTAGRLSKRLFRVQQDITYQVLTVNLAFQVAPPRPDPVCRIPRPRVIRAPPAVAPPGAPIDPDDRVCSIPTPRATTAPPALDIEPWDYWKDIILLQSGGESHTFSFQEENPAAPLAFASIGGSRRRRRSYSSSPSYATGYGWVHFGVETPVAMSSRLRVFSLFELDAATNNFSCEQVIHEGDHATLYKGVLPDGSMVAIKRSRDGNDLLFPVHLQHKNVVTSLGHCRYDQGEIVVEEYMPRTLSVILNEKSGQLDWSFTLQTVRGIAEGVAYLQTMRVVHPDLKPANIFFDSDMNPKIGGFGRSKLLLEQGVTQIKTQELLGTVGNVPPEYITDGIISMKSNVFSFGILLLRLISGMRGPVLEQHPIAWALEVWEAQQMEPFDSSSLDESELNERERCICIGLLCTQMDPRDRPTMPDVLDMLGSKEELPTPKISGFLRKSSAEKEQPWWRSSWWKWWSDGRKWTLLENTQSDEDRLCTY